ncbi:MAG: alanine--tRNA ligase [Candidatus Omnitrophica bacterium]|nr:alanine--tRNA ligase [Candidatus Omnitrophota bacterium]
MKSSEIRSRYLEFFEKKGHVIVPSSSLIPHEDPTLLFTSAGMVQFKKYWATDDPLPYTRATSCQKCLRAGGKDSDLEKIGTSGKHHTFFEMLGNFSFGDYFKEEAINWAWEFVTQHLKICKDRLWVSYFHDDTETLKFWKKLLPESKIVPLGKKDNFWGPAGDTGPCGPCTEIYIDTGEDPSCQNNNCKPGCDCNRFLEFWNLVFPQYNQQSNGELLPLKRRGVDTGMGLERISRILQNKDSNYETDLFTPLIAEIEKISKISCNQENLRSFRIISDHIRAAVFLIGDGVYPDNEGRGYVLRRIIRRAHFEGIRIGIKEPFLTHLVECVKGIFEGIYKEIEKNTSEIKKVICEEEKKFNVLLSSSRKIFESDIKKLESKKIPGDIIFRWYDTYGIPRDLIFELAQQHNLEPDWEAFEHYLKKQKEMAKQKSIFEQKKQVIFEKPLINETVFTGYQETENKGSVLALYRISEKDLWEIVLDTTPFYPEKGGQIGDRGIIKGKDWIFEVLDTQIDMRGVIFHIGRFASGIPDKIKENEQVTAIVSKTHRMNVAANHTATHLLHYCLRNISNNQARQAGSYVGDDRLRFDFLFSGRLDQDMIDRIEAEINKIIFENHKVDIVEMDYQQAIKSGAVALFTEKYGGKVRVVKTGNFHSELCGGIHVNSTSEICVLKILTFSSIGENLKRIEAITREYAYMWFKRRNEMLLQAAEIMKTVPESLLTSIQRMKKHIQEMEKKMKSILEKSLINISEKLDEKKIQINNHTISIFTGQLDNIDLVQLGKIADNICSGKNSCVVLLAGVLDGRAVLVCKVTPDISTIVNASHIIKHIAKLLDGSGGGKPEFAQGSGRDITKIEQVISQANRIIPEIFNKNERK